MAIMMHANNKLYIMALSDTALFSSLSCCR